MWARAGWFPPVGPHRDAPRCRPARLRRVDGAVRRRRGRGGGAGAGGRRGRGPGRRASPPRTAPRAAFAEFVGAFPAQGAGVVRRQLQMELQPQHVVAVAERLIVAAPAARQMHGALGDREGVAVPVQHRGAVAEQGAERIAGAGLGALHREPADLPFRVGGHRRAQHPGDELGAEAHAEHLLPGLDAGLDQPLLVGHPG